jgi:hypothetical protein
MRNNLIIAVFISLFSFASTANGQKLINSPFSRFNIGTLQQVGSFRSLGMGGTGTAERDNSSIYFTNPASYSSLDTNSFVFDFGIDYGKNFLGGGTTKFSSDDLDFHHLIMGFPIKKGWGVAVGIVPISSGYYEITGKVTSTDPGYDPIVGEYNLTHTGDGGITKFFIGTGAKINKNFSVGANFVVLSGKLSRSNQFVFSQTSDFQTVFHNTTSENLELKGINFDYGIQYTASLKNNYFLNIGASLSTGNNFKSKFDQLSLKFSAYSVRDTVSYITDNNSKTFIPGTLKVGVSFGKKNKFTTGIDYTATKWSASKIPGSSGYAADTRNILFGAEFIPDKFSNYSFINRIEYRLGGHIGDNYLILNGKQVKEYGASLGFGIPMRQASTGTQLKANLFLDFTRRAGSLSSNLHSEDYLSLGISFNLYDFWFMKRKYD